MSAAAAEAALQSAIDRETEREQDRLTAEQIRQAASADSETRKAPKKTRRQGGRVTPLNPTRTHAAEIDIRRRTNALETRLLALLQEHQRLVNDGSPSSVTQPMYNEAREMMLELEALQGQRRVVDGTLERLRGMFQSEGGSTREVTDRTTIRQLTTERDRLRTELARLQAHENRLRQLGITTGTERSDNLRRQSDLQYAVYEISNRIEDLTHRLPSHPHTTQAAGIRTGLKGQPYRNPLISEDMKRKGELVERLQRTTDPKERQHLTLLIDAIRDRVRAAQDTADIREDGGALGDDDDDSEQGSGLVVDQSNWVLDPVTNTWGPPQSRTLTKGRQLSPYELAKLTPTQRAGYQAQVEANESRGPRGLYDAYLKYLESEEDPGAKEIVFQQKSNAANANLTPWDQLTEAQRRQRVQDTQSGKLNPSFGTVQLQGEKNWRDYSDYEKIAELERKRATKNEHDSKSDNEHLWDAFKAPLSQIPRILEPFLTGDLSGAFDIASELVTPLFTGTAFPTYGGAIRRPRRHHRRCW